MKWQIVKKSKKVAAWWQAGAQRKPSKEQSIKPNTPGRFPPDSELITHKGHCVLQNAAQSNCYQGILTNSLDFQKRENKQVTYKEKRSGNKAQTNGHGCSG